MFRLTACSLPQKLHLTSCWCILSAVPLRCDLPGRRVKSARLVKTYFCVGLQWKWNSSALLPSCISIADWIRLFFRIWWSFSAFMFPPTFFISLLGPAADKHPQSMTLPPPCFMVDMASLWRRAGSGVYQKLCLVRLPKNIRPKTLLLACDLESPTGLWGNSRCDFIRAFCRSLFSPPLSHTAATGEELGKSCCMYSLLQERS